MSYVYQIYETKLRQGY